MWVFGQTVLRKYYSVYDAKRWRVGVGPANHTAARRPGQSTLPTPRPEGKKEVCKDDDASMQKSPFSLPGCRSFAQMGYCGRFLPLAHHYCRLSCRLCKPAGAAASPNATGPSVLGKALARRSSGAT
mmetsp:Transcript_33182/g.98784  ORF Transcript_33182/g.98784 Transcript_33182/m.98784 type:complete len:127 (+) Transcript_33182:170-550(+)